MTAACWAGLAVAVGDVLGMAVLTAADPAPAARAGDR